jgi:hypothetical protein
MSNSVIVVSQAVTVVNEAIMHEEAYPGHLLDVNADAEFTLQATASIAAEKMILIENDFLGKGVTVAAAAATRQRAAVLRAGDRFYCRLAAAQTIVVGNKLEANGGGTFKLYSAGVPLVRALEASTAGSTANDFLLVEVL